MHMLPSQESRSGATSRKFPSGKPTSNLINMRSMKSPTGRWTSGLKKVTKGTQAQPSTDLTLTPWNTSNEVHGSTTSFLPDPWSLRERSTNKVSEISPRSLPSCKFQPHHPTLPPRSQTTKADDHVTRWPTSEPPAACCSISFPPRQEAPASSTKPQHRSLRAMMKVVCSTWQPSKTIR